MRSEKGIADSHGDKVEEENKVGLKGNAGNYKVYHLLLQQQRHLHKRYKLPRARYRLL